jgi:hypothetical protein
MFNSSHKGIAEGSTLGEERGQGGDSGREQSVERRRQLADDDDGGIRTWSGKKGQRDRFIFLSSKNLQITNLH